MIDCLESLRKAGYPAPASAREVPANGVDLQAVAAERRPVIIRGLIEAWPAVQAARSGTDQLLEYLLRFDHGAIVPISAGPATLEGRLFYSDDFTGLNVDRGNATMTNLLRQVAHHGRHDPSPLLYLASSDVDMCLPGFRAENDLSPPPPRSIVSAWIGTRSRVAAHNDLPLNFACCVAGKRRFLMFPPDQTPNLYVGPFETTPAGRPISMVDFAHPSPDQFPRFSDAMARAEVAELAPGDVLFIPSMWWHHVEAVGEFNILINYWWREAPAFLGTPQDVLVHAMMTLRDLPPEDRDIWRDIFEHYVFSGGQDLTKHLPPELHGNLGPMTEEKARSIRAFLLNRLNR